MIELAIGLFLVAVIFVGAFWGGAPPPNDPGDGAGYGGYQGGTG